MDKFRTTVQRRFRFCVGSGIIAMPVFFGLMLFTNGIKNDYFSGLLLGFFSALEIWNIVYLCSLWKILRDEKLLKELYIKETDERNRSVLCETSRSAFLLIIFACALAVLISGFFSITVSLTIAAVMLGSVLIFGALHSYYSKTM